MPRTKKAQDEGVIEVKRIQYGNGEIIDEEEHTETVRVPNFSIEGTGRVNVRGSITRNLGNFNSVRVECGIELPCLPELSEVDRVYDICSKFVEDKISAELENAIGDRNPNIESVNAQTESKPGIRSRVAG